MSTTTVAIFRNLRISLAGVDDHRRKKASKIVGFLGGEVTDNCLSGLNCSIVDKVGSAAFLKAQDLNITTVTIQWLYDCYKFRKVLAFEEYKLKPLQGLVVSCSQLDNHDRLKLEQAVLENGGTFSPELSKEKCTHLIVDFPKGDKYQHAKLWRSIHIVSKSWIDDVVKAQKWLPEVNYLVLPSSFVSSKSHSASESEHGKTSKRLRSSSLSNAQDDLFVLCTLSNLVDKKLEDVSIETLLSYRERELAEEPFDSGLFFLLGYQDKVENLLKSLLVHSGGLVSPMLTENVQFIIAHSAADVRRLKANLPQLPNLPKVLNSVWLIGKCISWRAIVELIDEFKQNQPSSDIINSFESLLHSYSKVLENTKIVENLTN